MVPIKSVIFYVSIEIDWPKKLSIHRNCTLCIFHLYYIFLVVFYTANKCHQSAEFIKLEHLLCVSSV